MSDTNDRAKSNIKKRVKSEIKKRKGFLSAKVYTAWKLYVSVAIKTIFAFWVIFPLYSYLLL